ncbi:MAG: hypothetical protein K8S56_05320 [Candidatus Cloacimonetes bacterium]|nr:hypothetical protein [Candidatus Cloacimonadota bacterium]
MKWFNLLLIIGLLGLFTACAQPNDPAQTSSAVIVISEVSTLGYAKDVDINDTHIFVAEDKGGFSIFRRDNLELVHQIQEFDGAGFTSVRRIQVLDITLTTREVVSRLFVYDTSDSDKIIGFDITDMDTLRFAFQQIGGTQSLGDLLYMENIDEIPDYAIPPYINYEVVMLRTLDNQLKYGWLDVKADGSDLWLGSPVTKNLPNTVKGFDQDTTYWYLAGSQLGLHIVEKSTQNLIASIDTPGSAYRVCLQDGFAFITTMESRSVSVIKLNNYTDARLLDSSFYTISFARSLDIDGKYMVVGTHGVGIFVVDISDPYNMRLVRNVPKSEVGYVNQVRIDGNDIYVASRDNGLVYLRIIE